MFLNCLIAKHTIQMSNLSYSCEPSVSLISGGSGANYFRRVLHVNVSTRVHDLIATSDNGGSSGLISGMHRH